MRPIIPSKTDDRCSEGMIKLIVKGWDRDPDERPSCLDFLEHEDIKCIKWSEPGETTTDKSSGTEEEAESSTTTTTTTSATSAEQQGVVVVGGEDPKQVEQPVPGDDLGDKLIPTALPKSPHVFCTFSCSNTDRSAHAPLSRSSIRSSKEEKVEPTKEKGKEKEREKEDSTRDDVDAERQNERPSEKSDGGSKARMNESEDHLRRWQLVACDFLV